MPAADLTLYAYVCGSDLHSIELVLMKALKGLVESRDWICGAPRLVNQRHEPDSSVGPGDLPDWDIGLNHVVPAPGREKPGWFSDVQHIAECLGRLCGELSRQFVIGIHDPNSGATCDLYYVTSNPPDMDYLAKIIGVEQSEGH